MKFNFKSLPLRTLFAVTILICQTLPVSVVAQELPLQRAVEDKATNVVRDVRLQPNGRLELRLLNRSGRPEGGHVVKCVYQGRVIAQGKTDAAGRVAISSLRSGIHVVSAAGTTVAYRFWNSKTAPPSAITSPAIVASDTATRGQYGYGPPPMMAPGLLATGVTIAAVAAILAGKNSGGKSTVSPPASP